MSTGCGWEGIRQVCATLLGARHVLERLGRYNKCSTFTSAVFLYSYQIPARSLRSSHTNLLSVPRVRMTFVSRRFSVAASSV